MRKLALALLLTTALHAQISPTPADAVVPVVGSTRGQSNANFKTELQMANTTDFVMSGWMVLRPHALTRRYEIQPRATLSFADVVADLGASGLGSIDILLDQGPLPTIVVRAYDDQPGGTTGVTVPVVRSASVLAANNAAALIVPRDLTAYRFNIGIRTLGLGAELEIVVRSANGTPRFQRAVTFDADHFEQHPGDIFAGTPLQHDDSIAIRVLSGSAIVYATTVDNRTNDSSIQVATR